MGYKDKTWKRKIGLYNAEASFIQPEHASCDTCINKATIVCDSCESLSWWAENLSEDALEYRALVLTLLAPELLEAIRSEL